MQAATLLTCVLVASICSLMEAGNSGTDCGTRKGDIVLLVDDSTSVQKSIFSRYVRPFLQELVKHFQVGPQATFFSYIRFSNSVKMLFPLNRYQTKAALLKAMERLRFYGGGTRIVKALKYALDYGFRSGSRRDAEKVIILITDGKSTEKNDVADALNKAGIRLIVVGVGSGVDPNQLKALAGEGNAYYLARSYNIINSIGESLTKEVCEALGPCHNKPCKNGGKCVETSDGKSYTCQCTQQFTGTHCESALGPCHSKPCQNGGTCTEINNGQSFTCTCPSTFTGRTCQTALGPCHFKPCKNGGTCTETNNGQSYTCSCPPTFTGESCQTALGPCHFKPCHNGGTCTETNNGQSYTCSCPRRFTGRTCETALGPCHFKPCLNGGVCSETDDNQSYMCNCPPTFTGKNCENELDICLVQEHGCSQYCVSNSLGYNCTCGVGYALADDRKTCKNVAELLVPDCSDGCMTFSSKYDSFGSCQLECKACIKQCKTIADNTCQR